VRLVLLVSVVLQLAEIGLVSETAVQQTSTPLCFMHSLPLVLWEVEPLIKQHSNGAIPTARMSVAGSAHCRAAAVAIGVSSMGARMGGKGG
jgi:hypothetical protein